MLDDNYRPVNRAELDFGSYSEEDDSYNEEEEDKIDEGETNQAELTPNIKVAPGKSAIICFFIIVVLMILQFSVGFIKKLPQGESLEGPEKIVKKLLADIGSQLYQGIGDRDLNHYYYNLQNLGHLLNLNDSKQFVINEFRKSGLEYLLKKDLNKLASYCYLDYYRTTAKLIFMVFNDFILNNYEIPLDKKTIQEFMYSCVEYDDVTELLFINLRSLSYMGFYNSLNNAMNVITAKLPELGSGPWYNLALNYISKIVSETKIPQKTINKICTLMDQIKLEDMSYNAKTSYNLIKEHIVCIEPSEKTLIVS